MSFITVLFFAELSAAFAIFKAINPEYASEETFLLFIKASIKISSCF